MKRMKLLLLLAGIVLAAFWLSGCDSGPTEPTVAPKTPEQLAAEQAAEAKRLACVQDSIDASFRQGGSRVSTWFSKDFVVVFGEPQNARGAALALDCDPPFSRAASWTILVGPGMNAIPVGDVRRLVFDMRTEGEGLVAALVTHFSQGKSFNGETVGLVSTVGVSARGRPSEARIRELMVGVVAWDLPAVTLKTWTPLERFATPRAPTPYELGLAARALRNLGRSR